MLKLPSAEPRSATMDKRLILVRHGHSSHTKRPGWIDSSGVHRWRELYDAAGILSDSAPPADLVAIAASAGCVMTSDLPRAVASAERLAPTRAARISPLLRETPLEVPRWATSRWPLGVWEAWIYVHWLAKEWRGEIAPPDELQRATDAVALLDEAASESKTVVVVTHGAFRRLLARRLVETGWIAERRVGGFRNWSAWPFRSGKREGGSGKR